MNCQNILHDIFETEGSTHRARERHLMALSVRSLAIVSTLFRGGGVLFIALVKLAGLGCETTRLGRLSLKSSCAYTSRYVSEVLLSKGYALFARSGQCLRVGWLSNLIGRGSGIV